MEKTRIKVLLVDDEAQFSATTEKILKRRGFSVLTAQTGEQALEKLADNPDVVILDIRMPGMGGLEALERIRGRAPDLPVIMLTGHGSEGTAQQALKKGAYDFLSKPCDIDLLASKLSEACRSSFAPRESIESRVKDAMIPLDDYTTVSHEASVREAVLKLRESFTAKAASGSIMETGHRSVLVMDGEGGVKGILCILDLMKSMMPAYLSLPKPSMADAIQYSPLFWAGMFTRSLLDLAELKISEIMSPAPPSIEAEASLMEAAYVLIQTGERRLAVTNGSSTVVGVIREQDLFFEMDRILRT